MSRQTLKSTFEKVKIDDEGEFVCRCGFRMKEYLVKREKNPYYGLKFYACAKFIVDTTRCDAKIWFDEQVRVRALIPPEMKSPRTPRKQVDIRIFGQYTPPTSLKRMAEAQSFDSEVGDLGDNEPVSPPPSRSVKKTRFENETQTRGATAACPVRPLPRRRLFDEHLAPPKPNPQAEIDPFAPKTLNRDITTSQPIGQPVPLRPRPSSPRTEEPVATSNTTTAGLIAPSTEKRHQVPRPSIEEPKTLTGGSKMPKRQRTPNLYDSDSDTYGWDSDLNQNILEVADDVENPRSSPLFI
ncbi:hypothetical protein BJX70DRAFT_357072 [Aspergillus crustosus]